MSTFAYLHTHTRFSRAGGPASPLDYCRRASELGYTSLGFTDRSPLADLPSIFAAAQETGITPLYGIELDLILPSTGPRKAEPGPQPAILFARSLEGMLNLARIASHVYSGWPASEKPLDWETLAAHCNSLLLVLLGGDEAGALTPLVANAKKQADLGRIVKATFGDAAFVGVPHAGRPGDNVLAGQVVSAAGALEIPAVATPTARYIHPDDAPSYEALKAARKCTGWPRDEANTSSTASIAPDRPGHDYLRAPDDAAALYADWPVAVENVMRIVEMCTFAAGTWPFVVQQPTGADAFLRDMAQSKLLPLLGTDSLPADVAERLDRELHLLTGQAGAWALLSSLPTRPGEGTGGSVPLPLGAPIGTASGSLLGFALGLSPINPLANTLPTWLHEGSNVRRVLPLPGVEIAANRRDDLLSSLVAEHGPGRIARAGCPLPITPTQAVQAAAGVLGISGEQPNSLALSTLSDGWEALSPGRTQTGSVERLADLALTLKDVPLTFQPDPDVLIAAPRQTNGTGTLSSYGPLLQAQGFDWLPWSAQDIADLGYPALTLRPTQSLSLLDKALSLARRYPHPSAQAVGGDTATLPDAAIQALHKGDLVGIPYLAKSAVKDWPAESTLDTVAQAVARSLHPSRPPVPDPKPDAWDEITASTSGALLFRDQVIALLLALGISAEDAGDTLRALVTGCGEGSGSRFAQALNLDPDTAASLWTALAAHAKAAVERDAVAAWGKIALRLVALKSVHPAAFLAAVLSTASSPKEIEALAEEAARLGVKLEPPDVGRSESSPTLQRDGEAWAVLWGLGNLPGWQDMASRFVAARPPAGFTSLREVALAAVDVGLSVRHLETLVRSGACDNLGTLGAPIRDHASMLAVLPDMLAWAQATRRSEGQLDLFAAPVPDPPAEEDLREGGDNAPGVAHTPRMRYLRRLWEQNNLGVTFTPADEMHNLISSLEKSGALRSRLLTTTQVGVDHLGTSINMVGVLCSIRLVDGGSDAGPDPLAVGWLEDVEGGVELVAFPPNYKRHADLWAESNLVVVTARVSSHDDGEIYLLSEHMAPFQAGSGEEAMTLTIKAPRQPKNPPKPDISPAVSVPLTPAAQPVVAAASALQPAARPAPTPSSSGDEQPRYSLVISIPPVGDDHAVIDSMIALNALLNAHPGPDSVTLRVQYSPETGKWTSARLPAGVRFTPLLENSIRRLLGDDALAVIKLLG
jgi:DNA polymerase-3 subunit alpha